MHSQAKYLYNAHTKRHTRRIRKLREAHYAKESLRSKTSINTITDSIQTTDIEDDLPQFSEQFLRFNISGTSYMIRSQTAYRRLPDAFLGSFVMMSIEERTELTEAFLNSAGEWQFQRSVAAFDPIFRFYVSGSLHSPTNVCWPDFEAELQYWQVPMENICKCCAPLLYQEEKEDEDVQKTAEQFVSVSHGAFRKRVWSITESTNSIASSFFSLTSTCFVLLSILALIFGSLPEFQVAGEPHPVFDYLEYACIGWFTAEYIIRLFVSPNKRSFILTPINVIDFVSIAPFFLEITLLLAGWDTVALQNVKGALLIVRILRVLRVVRVFKLGRHSEGMRQFALTMKNSSKQLLMLCAVTATGIVFFSTIMYYIEKDEPNTPYSSIPAAFWWCLVTMSTVGYGDVVPATLAGKVVAVMTILMGLVTIALPITSIVDNFMKLSYERRTLARPNQGSQTNNDSTSSGAVRAAAWTFR